jgi:hypothetical protein
MLEICALRLSFYSYLSNKYLRLALSLLQFLPDLSGLYALRHEPNFYEIHPRSI